MPFVLLLIFYIWAVVISSRHYRKWPIYRTISWLGGTFCAVAAVAGPLAERAHMDFPTHMIGHLLLGMLAPLLMVLAAPMTLLLRTLPVNVARGLTWILKSFPVRILSDPIIASLLNIGGLWILYTTNLFGLMHQSVTLHILIHIHVFLAGYLFTISMIYIDPIPHRRSYVYRSIVLVAALAAHGILSKYIYANPPAGVAADKAESGAMLMFYGGDMIDGVIIFILCLQWYKAAKPRQSFVSVENQS
nr:cytochrome c oxidase assembly protein [Sutcliffiella deserti]